MYRVWSAVPLADSRGKSDLCIGESEGWSGYCDDGKDANSFCRTGWLLLAMLKFNDTEEYNQE